MEKKIPASIFNQSLSFNPWLFFFFFLISNSLLSFYPFPLQIQLFIVFFGLILPFTVGFKIVSDFKILEPDHPNEDFFTSAKPLWILMILFLLIARFYRLTTIPAWLSIDEGYESALGM